MNFFGTVRSHFFLAGGLLLIAILPQKLNAQTEPPKPTNSISLSRIASGTVIKEGGPGPWNRVVLLSQPRIASGSVDSLSDSIRQSVSKFILTIVASVQPFQSVPANATVSPSVDQPNLQFRLAGVGIGYGVRVGEDLKVIRSDDYQQQGVSLSFIQRQMLVENERQFESLKIVSSNATVAILDAPALIHLQGKHLDCTMRHLIWLDPSTGALATLVWLLEATRNRSMAIVAERPAQWVDSRQIEDRAIHVDGAQFTLGIPSKRAFALDRLPAGRPINWTSHSQQLAALDRYDFESLRQLLQSFTERMK
jgi:hypothetical protein